MAARGTSAGRTRGDQKPRGGRQHRGESATSHSARGRPTHSQTESHLTRGGPTHSQTESHSTRGRPTHSQTESHSTRGRPTHSQTESHSTRGRPTHSHQTEPPAATEDSERGGRGRGGRRGSQSTAVSSRGSDGSTSQSTRGRPTTVASASAGDSVKQGSQSSAVDSTKEHERNLRKRLDELQLSKTGTSENASAVNMIQEIILQYLKNDDRSLKWKVCPSGSYYERTKIHKPDEYDCMMVCDMRCKPDYNCCSDNAVFCAFKSPSVGPKSSYPHLLTVQMNDGAFYVSPKAFKKHFRDKILDAIEREKSGSLKDLEIVVQLNDAGCPAVTLTVCGQRTSAVQRLSIDVVPAIQLMEWPKPAKTWKLKRNEDLECKIKHPDESGIHPFAVAKVHHTETKSPDNECILWRISFSAAEKQLTLHADQGTTAASNGSASAAAAADHGQTCRKSVIRLLKSDLHEFKVNNESNDVLCSFHIKTTFLHLMDKKPDASDWTRDHLLSRYIDGLRMLVKSLEKGEIRHYFIRSANLLDELTGKKRQLNAVEQYFSRLLVKYTG